jgi:type IV pilus assembly protein PilQ
MAGMKTRLTRIRTLAPSKAKGSIYGIFLLLLAFAVPGFNNAQDKPDRSWPSQQPSPVPISKDVGTQSVAKKALEETAAKILPAAITDIKIAPEDETATITVTTDRLLSPREFMLVNPPRLVVDFPNAENKLKTSPLPVHAASVKQIRIAQFQNSPSPIARMVLDLEKEYGSHEITANKSSIILAFHKGQSKSTDLKSGLASKPALDKVENESLLSRSTKSVSPSVLKSGSAKPAPNKVEKAPSLPRLTESVNPSVPAYPAAKATEASAPLVSALTPAAMAAPAIVQSNSRFSGQPLTLDFVDTPLVDFFRLLAEEGGVNIVLDPAVKGSISIKVVKMPWDQIFEAALVNNGLDKQVEGTLIRIAKKSTLQEEDKQRESSNKTKILASELETRVKPLNYAKAVTLAKIISDQKTVRGTVVVDERTNALILTDIPDSVDRQLQLIEKLDMPQAQVEIEARIVSGTRDFARDIGIQFGFVAGNSQRVTVGGTNTSSNKNASNSSSSSSSMNAGNYNVNLPAGRAFGGAGISIGNIFDTFLLDAAITAGESKGRAKLISQPRVTAQNNSQATVTQGLRFPVPVNANNTVTVQFFNAALTLAATPQITDEGNIFLDLKIENDTADFSNMVMGVPSIRTTESSTRVLVSDGGTTLISGIMIENESESEDKVPGLGSLPFVGNLFRRSTVLRNTQEVLFFITPRIIK